MQVWGDTPKCPTVNNIGHFGVSPHTCMIDGDSVLDSGGVTVHDVAWLTWREAMQRALYGPDGFFRRERPADHFRTSVHASELFTMALSRLAAGCRAEVVIDIGAGRGELLTALAQHRPPLELIGVELTPRPPGLPDSVIWTDEVPRGVDHALVVANEWLDNVPLDVAEVDADGRPRLVRVDRATGEESLGEPVTGEDERWLAEWWPLAGGEPGRRAEIGHSRDAAWAAVVGRIGSGVLVAADYSHRCDDRPPFGTLAAYRDGRIVAPVPDGSRDITAHVALDSCAAAGQAAGATATLLTTQRHALRRLGVDAGLPARELAVTDPAEYVAALSRASQAAELLDGAGFGGFGWLVQAVRSPLPSELTSDR
jgi:SAM-dependent MidA family methyltransferase